MAMQTAIDGSTVTVFLTGDLDHHGATALREQVDALIHTHRPKRLVLDFGGLSFMDSSGIGFVMGRYKRMTAHGGTLRVRSATPRMERVMRLAGLERLPIWDGSTQEG